MADKMPYLASTGVDFTSTTHRHTYPAINPATASNLQGRSVLITGAANGIGRAMVLSFARAGASQIAVADKAAFQDLQGEVLRAARDNNLPAPQTLQLVLDITDRAEVESAANKVAASFGGLDLLINNAGRFASYIPMLDSDPVDYWNTFEVNLGGTFNVTRYFLPILLDKPRGLKTLVTVSSIGALTVRPGGSAYRTTKLAILRYTETLAADYAERGLLAYSIHPGGILTDLGKCAPEEMHSQLLDTPDLPADTVVWLTQERRDWLAGRYVSCNWDMPELLQKQKEIVEGDKLKMRMAF
jgi:NAD(P)-dependent dehydrogenase (short-subunit alcohol dehydrogenase family)